MKPRTNLENELDKIINQHQNECLTAKFYEKYDRLVIDFALRKSSLSQAQQDKFGNEILSFLTQELSGNYAAATTTYNKNLLMQQRKKKWNLY
ncbi:MAG TPA: hypothetical protein VL360_03005 [Gammaproteobacteria bacterium]|jgi:hypothetical protein|nr:hypothetical protein [Gammaproteobacteria bacterium]